MTTLEEKQRELDALQSAFDDYIASSRELEEELEAELTKCREFSSFIFYTRRCPFTWSFSTLPSLAPLNFIIHIIATLHFRTHNEQRPGAARTSRE